MFPGCEDLCAALPWDSGMGSVSCTPVLARERVFGGESRAGISSVPVAGGRLCARE